MRCRFGVPDGDHRLTQLEAGLPPERHRAQAGGAPHAQHCEIFARRQADDACGGETLGHADGRLLIDHWNDHPVTDASGTLTLIAGRRYSVRLEYYENRGLAVARLTWASASQTREPVPASRLSPPSL